MWLPTHSEDTRVMFNFAHSYESPDSNTIAGSLWDPSSGVTYDDRRGDIWGDLTPPFYPASPLPIFQDVRDTTTDNIGIEVIHNFNPNLTLTALTSFTRSNTDRKSINYGLSVASPFVPEAWNVVGDFDQQIASQEVRLNYESDGLRWVGGLYIADETNKGSRDQFAVNSTFSSVETTSTRNKNDISNYALFGEATYEFAPKWSVVAGGRVDYYKQKQSSSISVVDLFAGPISDSSSSSSHSETAFIPKIGIIYDVDASNSISLIYQEGYRPGGSAIQLNTGNPYDYDPERAKNLELSWHGSLSGGRLNIGASLFYQDWDNQQVEIWEIANVPDSSVILNAGESTSYGGELELTYQVNDLLNVYTGVGLLHSEFKDFSIGSTNLSGQAFSNAPEQMAVLGFQWGDTTGWFAGGNVKYVSSSLARIESSGVRTELGSYTTVDALAGYTWDHGLSIMAYANNLFDEQYFTYESSTPDTQASLGARREVGVQIRKVF